jgi:hypothetical protein
MMRRHAARGARGVQRFRARRDAEAAKDARSKDDAAGVMIYFDDGATRTQRYGEQQRKRRYIFSAAARISGASSDFLEVIDAWFHIH